MRASSVCELLLIEGQHEGTSPVVYLQVISASLTQSAPSFINVSSLRLCESLLRVDNRSHQAVRVTPPFGRWSTQTSLSIMSLGTVRFPYVISQRDNAVPPINHIVWGRSKPLWAFRLGIIGHTLVTASVWFMLVLLTWLLAINPRRRHHLRQCSRTFFFLGGASCTFFL